MPTINSYELRVRPVEVDGLVCGRVIKYPSDVMCAARELIGYVAEEHFIAFALNVRNEVLGYYTVAVGSVDSCPVDMRTVFRTCVALGASSLAAVHNHPSGSTNPSEDDIKVTRRIKDSAMLLGLHFIDHIIVAGDQCYSLREHKPELFR